MFWRCAVASAQYTSTLGKEKLRYVVLSRLHPYFIVSHHCSAHSDLLNEADSLCEFDLLTTYSVNRFRLGRLVRREFSTSEYSVYLMGGANAERNHVYPVYRYAAPTSPRTTTMQYHLHRCRPCALRSSTIINAAVAAARRAAVTAIECLWESRSVWAKTGGFAAAAVTQSWHVIHGIA